VVGYDADAVTHDDEKYPADVQREWVARVPRLVPPGATVLDAPCGTDKYFAMLAADGVRSWGEPPRTPLSTAAAADLSCPCPPERVNALLQEEIHAEVWW
jgi:hypothetical protein